MRWAVTFYLGLVALLAQGPPSAPPVTWDEQALQDWATPIAALGVRPGHFSKEEYDRAPADNLRTYPVYYPGQEPAGYWDMIQKVGPQPLVDVADIKTDADWVRVGKRVFTEYDAPGLRVYDPRSLEAARRIETFQGRPVRARADGTLPDLRWVPTPKGLALGLANCGPCHTRLMPDGTHLDGAPPNEIASPIGVFGVAPWGVSPIELPGDTNLMATWRSWVVPWIKDDIHDQIKNLQPPQLGAIFGAAARPGLFPRWNGSGVYPTKMPDLIGIKDRKFIDHTATHQHRTIGDLMRYAALVTYSDSSDFGPHRILTDAQRRVVLRTPDAVLYALARYIYSLEPPPNPNRSDPRIAAGQALFQSQGCAGCHAPPLYTNNRLTLATGFTPGEAQAALKADIMPISVGTDPSLALKTRKGTGFYKVPSLKGVWYRGRYLHDGSLTTLEEMFDPARLRDDFKPSGFTLPDAPVHAVKGHEFGTKLTEPQRTELIAFLRSL